MAMGPRLLVALTILVCFAAGIYAAGIDPQPMSAADATRFARRALEESGVRGATFNGKVEASTFTPTGSKPVAVWRVTARVGDDDVALFIEQVGDQVLNLDDEIGPGRHVLSDQQFAALGRFRYDPVRDRARDRQFLPALVAGGLIGLTGAALSIVAGRGFGQPDPGTPDGAPGSESSHSTEAGPTDASEPRPEPETPEPDREPVLGPTDA